MKLLRGNLIQNKIMLCGGDGKGIKLQHRISFVTSLTISRWLKKYYYSKLLWSEFSKYKIENYSLVFDTTQLCIISCENLK